MNDRGVHRKSADPQQIPQKEKKGRFLLFIRALFPNHATRHVARTVGQIEDAHRASCEPVIAEQLPSRLIV